MTISITRYVDITSGVGGEAGVPRREFGLRQFTQNPLVPAGAVVSFTQLTDVQKYFGTAADEYKAAEKYFGFVSKQITSPKRMSVVRWHPAAVAPAVYGSPISVGASAFAAITTGTLAISVSGAEPAEITAIDFSTALTMADVATILQTKIRTSALPQLATATVLYETNRGVLILTGAVATPGDTLTFENSGADDLGAMTGWLTGLQVNQTGAAGVTAQEAVANSADEDDNFGSFEFTGTVIPTTLPAIVAIAAWNHAQNVKFIYCLAVSGAIGASYSAALIGYSGTALTLLAANDDGSDHPEQIPAEILGATNFNRPAASQNYMFYQFSNRLFAVDSNSAADIWDPLRVNYIGRTQTGGQKLAFYQKGYLMGGSTAPIDMAVYTGEMWLKDAFVSTIMGGFLALPSMPANAEGRITLLSLMQDPIDQALTNGVISVGKEFDATQRAYITQVTGSSDAWRQVQSKGYWIDAAVVKTVENGVTTYTAEYVLVYGKNDQIRKVTGSDILI